MNEQIIQDWLVECEALSPVEVNSFASSLKHNTDLISDLYAVLDDHTIFRSLIDPICKQLFNFYRSKEIELKLFTLQFLPNLVYIYLNSVARGEKKNYSSLETLLIGMYNLEVVDDAGQPTVISFRMPSLAQASIYHEPMSLAHASLTETALRRLEECNTKLISWGPHPQVETLNAQNRLKIITGLMFIYNRHIGSLNKTSLKSLCKISSSLACQGFKGCISKEKEPLKVEGSDPPKLPRIPVSSQFFLELLCGLYYAMYNGCGYIAMKAVSDIYYRSCFESFANVIIVTNAIINSSHFTGDGQVNEDPMGISVALSPATTTFTTVNKFMITNASFRTKKLPDDIPIITKDESGTGGDLTKPLTSITEEKEDTDFSARGSSLRSKDAMTKNLQKLGIGKKLKDKEGKTSSKTNLAVNIGSDKKQTTSLQISNFKEKGSASKSLVVVQNGDFGQADGDGHSPLSSIRKKTTENGPVSEVSNGNITRECQSNSSFPTENQSLLTSDGLDAPSSNDEVVSLFSTNKNHEEKAFVQVSSV